MFYIKKKRIKFKEIKGIFSFLHYKYAWQKSSAKWKV